MNTLNKFSMFDDDIFDDDASPQAELNVSNNLCSNHPKSKNELIEIIEKTINEKGFECDLNFIDTSAITDMSNLFDTIKQGNKFNGNISEWDVSHVTNMSGMFRYCDFTGDISLWNVSKVTNMAEMFYFSHFNNDVSHWDVSHATNMSWMFGRSLFNGDVNDWDISNLTTANYMFADSRFNHSLKNWNMKNVEFKHYFLDHCPLTERFLAKFRFYPKNL